MTCSVWSCSLSSAVWPKGAVNYLDIGLTAGLSLGFTFFVARFGTRTLRHVMPRVQARLRVAESEFALAMTLLFALSLLAVYAGVAAMLSKFVACGAGALGMGRTDAIRVGVGMVPRGEVGMVVAQIGLNLGVIGHNIYATIVFMSVATTLIAPPLLKMAFRAPTEMETDMVRLG